jgi:superfamily I DNA/RNA helicase
VNLLEKIEDHIANESFQKLFSRSIATLKRTIGKSDIAATKKKVLQAALTACLTELKAISHSDQFAKEAQKITKALEKAIKAKELIT